MAKRNNESDKELILKTIIGTFEEVLYADLKENTIQIWDGEKGKLVDLPGSLTFDQFIDFSANSEAVGTASAAERVRREFSREQIIWELKTHGEFAVAFMSMKGESFNIKYMKASDDGTKAIIVRYDSASSKLQVKSLKEDIRAYDMAINEIYSMCMGVDVENNTYRLIRYNEHMSEMVPVAGDYDEMLKTVAKSIAPGESRKKFKYYLSREYRKEAQLRGDKDITLRIRHKLADGKYHWVENKTIFIREEKGLHQITLAKEIDDEIKYEKELEHAREKAEVANKSKSTFLFNMSHDIRTPMNAILGFTSLALDEKRNPAKTQEYLEKIHYAGNQLVDILNDVLELAQIENDKIIIDEKPIDINIIRRINVDMFKDQIAAKKLTFVEDWRIDHPYMYADGTHLGQVFINLISNAVKYTPDGGSITLTARQLPGNTPDDCLIVASVSDNGIGMSQEFQKHLFEKFERERNSTISGIQGTGLGLGIAKKLVELMGGTIEVSSRMGKGTVFTVKLPQRLCSKEDFEGVFDQDVEEHDQKTSFAGKRILLAEDNELNAEIALEVLKSTGLEIDWVKDGLECVKAVQQHEPGHYDGILMDVQMPNMDGYKATSIIRSMENKKNSKIPIIAMTANAFKEDEKKAKAAGMNGHVAKPLNVQKLFDTLKKIILKK